MILRLPASTARQREHGHPNSAGRQKNEGLSHHLRASQEILQVTILFTSQTPPPRRYFVLHGNGDRGPERALPAQLGPGDGYMERDDASPREAYDSAEGELSGQRHGHASRGGA